MSLLRTEPITRKSSILPLGHTTHPTLLLYFSLLFFLNVTKMIVICLWCFDGSDLTFCVGCPVVNMYVPQPLLTSQNIIRLKMCLDIFS